MGATRQKEIFGSLVRSTVGDSGWRLSSVDVENDQLVFKRTADHVVTLRVPVAVAPAESGNVALDARVILIHERSRNHSPDDVAVIASWVKRQLEAWQKEQRKAVHSIGRDRGRIHINFEAACDYKCLFCDEHLRNAQLARTEIAAVLADLEKAGGFQKTKKVTISCNEPFGNPGFVSLLDYLEKKGVPEVEVFTTGQPLADFEFLGKLKGRRSLRIHVPLYGVTARSHESVTGRKGSFDRVTTALRGLKALHILVTIHTVALRHNVAELDRLADRVFREYGTKLFVHQLIPISDDKIRYASLMPRYEDIRRLKCKNVVFMDFPPCEVPGSQPAEAQLQKDSPFNRKKRIKRCARCRHRAECDGMYEIYLETLSRPSVSKR